MYDYKFSIIIPIYNSERYLDETIESIVNQTIGFENIQLILINDGSKDNSEDICFKYIEKNLNNIIYIKQENKGQSFARNAGYKYIEGEYVNFLDSDDKLEKDGLEKVYNYFNDNKGQFNLVIIPRKFFEKLDYVMESYQKYTQNSIVDILKDVDRREGGVCNVFFKNKLIKKYSFDSNCLLIEDFKLIYTILISEQKYGYLSNTYYLYRIRDTGDSVSNSVIKNKFNYTERIRIVYIYMIKLSIKIYGEVILFLQNAIFGNLISAFLSEKLYLDDCSKDEKKQFFEDLKFVISSIDDELILKNITLGYQIYGLFLLNFKYKEQYVFNNKININRLINKKIIENNIELYCFLNYNKIYVDEFHNIIIEFNIECPVDINITSIFGILDKFRVEALILNKQRMTIWDEECILRYNVILKVDLKKCVSGYIEFCLEIDKTISKFSGGLKIK